MTRQEKHREYMRRYRETNREKILAQRKAHYAANREKTLIAMKARRVADPEFRAAVKARYAANAKSICAERRAWYAANREKRLAQKKVYYAKNRERKIARERIWCVANPEKRADAGNRRRARKLAATAIPIPAAALRALKAAPCAYCDAPGPSTIDHMIPLARGGAHALENLTSACKRCNSRKCTKTAEDFRQQLGQEAAA